MKDLFAEEFPVLKHTTYLNTAYVGLLSKSLLEKRRTIDESYWLKGDQFKIEAYDSLFKNQEAVAKFVNANPTQTYLTANFSSGIRAVLNEIPKSSRFLTLEEDYPSLVTAISEAGFKTETVPIVENLEKEIERKFDKETTSFDVLALSMVQYVSGLMVDFEFLSRLKKKFPKLIIIGDATQMIGAFDFDFKKSPFDVIATSGYKWLLAGFGNGFVCVSNHFLKKVGLRSEAFHEKMYAGHFNMLGIDSLVFSIKRFQEWGFPDLLNRKQELTRFLKDELLGLDVLDSIAQNRSMHSSIFNIPGGEAMFQEMNSKKIRCALRGKGIRVSLHFYNSEAEVERLITFLKKKSK